MGNSCVTGAPHALLEKADGPAFQWKIYGFSSLLEKGATTVTSDVFHCCGYEWYLTVTPKHKKFGFGSPYVAVRLLTGRSTLEPDYIMNALFELSIYNHSNRTYCGCQDISFARKKTAVVPKKTVVVPKKPTTIQNLFIQKKEFIKGTYTWTMNIFLDSKLAVLSPAFEVGGYKWHIKMYPRGNKLSTKSLSLFLYMDKPSMLTLEPGMMIELTLSILDQKNGKQYTRSRSGCFAFAAADYWGWPNFIPRWLFKDQSFGYLVGSNCIVKADIAIVGSSIV
uniref:MATH domain-containing protein n=1 Tax=Setaria italica TaxID=4555 RepID=K4AMW8_SETIT